MDIQGIHFAQPDWLLGLAALPFLTALAFFLSRAKHSAFFLGSPRLVERSPTFLAGSMIPWVFRLVVLSLCLVAAARPQSGKKKMEDKKPVSDLVVALDVSESMLLDDLKPNRIVAAKQLLDRFLDEVKDTRIGLNVFAGVGFTQCPMTYDVALVKSLLKPVEVGSVRVGGTAIGDALLSSLNRLEKGTERRKEEQPKATLFSKWFGKAKEDSAEPRRNQAILLITDGESNAGSIVPLAAARVAAARGVKIHAVGVGSKEGVPVQYMQPNGRIVYGFNKNGSLVRSDPVDFKTLSMIAESTGGKAFRATDNRALALVLAEVAKLEKRDMAVMTHWEYNELASFFLLTAFCLLAMGLLLESTVLRTLP